MQQKTENSLTGLDKKVQNVGAVFSESHLKREKAGLSILPSPQEFDCRR